MQEKVVILGAGIAGIGAGYRFGKAAEIYEARERYGGLCDNFTVQGFRFDTAVHLSFAHEELVRTVFDKTPYYAHKPIAQNYCDGHWAKHPLQNNTFQLPADEKVRIIKSFIGRQQADSFDNYEQWLYSQYGKYFAQAYPMRYTRKYWCCEAADLSVEWITNRMYQPSIDEVLLGAMTAETPNTYYAEEMRYPKVGGYRAFFEHIADKMDIRLLHSVVDVDPKGKTVEFANGKTADYDHLVSSLPLPVIISCIKDAPAEVVEASKRLFPTSVTLVSVGFNCVVPFPSLWFYVYNEEILFARGYSPSMKSPDNAPEGKSSLQFEIYQSRNKRIPMNDDAIVENAVKSLIDMGIAQSGEIEVTDIRHVEYGNVVFYNGMEKDRRIVLDYLKGVGIMSVGRFGKWDYLWSNQSFMNGYNASL